MVQDPDDRKQFDNAWDKLNQKIKQKESNYVEPELPFRSSCLIKDFNNLYAKIYDKEKFIQAWWDLAVYKANPNEKKDTWLAKCLLFLNLNCYIMSDQ